MPPFDTFGGGAVHPSDVSYRSLIISEDTILQWPNLSEEVLDVAARIMDVSANEANLTIRLPSASHAGLGHDLLFRNLGALDFTVADNTGAGLGIVAVGEAKYFYLTSSGSAAGAWGVIQFGAGSSNADASSLAGAGLKAISTTLNQKHDVVELSDDHTALSTDRAKNLVWTGGTHTLTLPTSSSVGSDFFFYAKNAGSGTITATPASGDNIDGAASLNLAPNDGIIFFSGGSSNKWYTVAQGRPVTFAFTQLVKNVGGDDDIVLTSSEAANKVMTFTGVLTGNINVIVPNTVSVYYLFNNTSGSFSLTVKTAAGSGITVTQGTREIGVCDGADVRRGVDNTAATTLFSVGSESAPSVTFVTDSDTGLFRPVTDSMGIAGGGVEVARFTGLASAVNSWDFNPSTAGNPVVVQPVGDDASISVLIRGKGTNGRVLFDDDDFRVRDDGDVTKMVRFECSGITSGNTRTLTVPDQSGNIVLPGTTDTLTNKTITAPAISDATMTGTTTDNGSIMCPVGVILPYGGATAPTGWLLCFGQAISRTTYASLFAIFGTTYGAGDGSTTFNLPDLRGRVVAGKDDMGGTSANRLTSPLNGDVLGGAGGDEGVTLTAGQIPELTTASGGSHAHGIDVNDTNSFDGSASPVLMGNNSSLNYNTNSAGAHTHTVNAGGGGDHPNVQPTFILNYIVKT